jgi:hypothetical protein
MKAAHYVIRVKTDGTVEAVELNGRAPTRVELAGILDYWSIRTLPIRNGVLVVGSMDETESLAVNEIATKLFAKSSREHVRGDAVLCSNGGDRLIGFDRDRAEQIRRELTEDV